MCLHVHTFPQLAPPLERRQASNVCVAVRVAVCPSVAARGRTQAPIKDLALPKQGQPPFRGLATRHTEAGRKDGQNRRTREGSWDHEVLQRKGGRKGGDAEMETCSRLVQFQHPLLLLWIPTGEERVVAWQPRARGWDLHPDSPFHLPIAPRTILLAV